MRAAGGATGADGGGRSRARRHAASSATSRRRAGAARLDDAGAFEEVIARRGAELVLHGHNHTQSLHRLAGPRGAVPVVGVASASARAETHRPGAAYHLFSISRAGTEVRVKGRARGFDEASGEVVDLGALDL